MLEVVDLCGVDDAVLKEHAGAITAHYRGMGHFEDDPCIIHLSLRQRLLRARAFCENNMGWGVLLEPLQSPSREGASGDRSAQTVTLTFCLQLLRSGTLC